MKLKNLFLIASIALLSASCVTSKIHKDLQEKYDALRAENNVLNEQLDQTGANKTSINTNTEALQKCQDEKTRAQMELSAAKDTYNTLKESYNALAANSSENLTANFEQNKALLTQLEEKQRLLNDKEQKLKKQEQAVEKAQQKLARSAQRVAELEAIIAAKEAQMSSLKDAISKALINFEGKGLTVEQRDGKVYVSMENKLLFESGSWAVNTRGREAVVELGKVLSQHPEIAVLIEGHTDNVPYSGNGNIQNNWDLSTKRATAIVGILVENSTLQKNNLTAAGKGEYTPIATNETSEGKAKNRRIEVVLTPRLDEINALLNQM